MLYFYTPSVMLFAQGIIMKTIQMKYFRKFVLIDDFKYKTRNRIEINNSYIS